MKKRLLAALMAGAMALSMTACGSSSGSDDSNAASGGDSAKAGSYKVGVVQLVQHVALDAATKGFQDKLTELVEADGGKVEFDVQNASGESANCSTIVNGFVSAGDDLIMANATAALQAAQAATSDIPVLGTSVTDYGTALGISDWTGKTGTNISGTTDLAPLDGQADMLKELFPDAKNVGLLYCSAEPNSKYQIDTIKPLLEAQGYTCTEFAFTDSNDVASVAQNAASGSDLKLYGRWLPEIQVSFHWAGSVIPVDGDGQNIAAPSPLSLSLDGDGNCRYKATAPTADGFEFDGWYKDSDCTQKFEEGGEILTANTNLYGRWTRLGTKTVTFKVQNGK